ncbi:hypothetical protein [Hymenobacter defluvii]|uniref:Uncharacterized protein n=1 Tax=Hymenobacter defluvii TaxID=2054411 RepID=A0ABS3TBJ7_9BACT|nr:hypothetical protein [Hymenobacter defluvii]MBO3271041.1 hypothetical protein [Hymenobacter defluvii]
MKKVFLIPLVVLLLGHRPAWAQQERVGIGTLNPTQTLDVDSTLRVRTLTPPSGNQLLVALSDGTLGLSEPLAATAGLGLYAQVAGTNPVMIGPASGTAYTRVAAAGRYLFVAGGDQFKVYDAQATPTLPVYTGINSSMSGTVGALAASGNTLYAASTAGLDKFTISNGSTLALFAQYNLPLAPAGTTSTAIYDAVVAGRYLYVAACFSNSSNTVVRVLELSTGQPTSVATLPLGLTGRVQQAADESRGRLLVAPDAGALQVYALATPTAPTPVLVATAPATAPSLPTFEGGVAVVGGILYGANNATTPPTLDVYDEASPADPSQPAALGAVRLPKKVRDLAVAGEYAYLLTADASSYELVAVRVAAPALVGLDAAGNVASVAPVLPPTDNLGNHRATQNLNLAGFQLVGNGGSQGLRLDAGGRVGVLTAPSNNFRLDVGGTLRTTRTAVTGTLATPTLTASTSLSTPSLLAPVTGAHPCLAAATGQVIVSGSNTASSGSDNYSVARTGAGTYRLTFTAGPLATGNLQAAAFLAALVGTPGFVTFTASTTNPYIDVYTRNPSGTLTDRDFTFSVFLP